MWFSKSPYAGLDSSDKEDEQESLGNEGHQYPALRSSRVTLQLAVSATGWLLSGVLLVILAIRDGHTGAHDCFVETSAYSPLVDYVPRQLVHVRTNGSLDFPSKFRGRPDQELDDNWDRISIFRPLNIPVSDEQYSRFGSSIQTAVRSQYDPEAGFFLQPEFSHQLHCVNLLRKATWYNHDYYRDTGFDFQGNDQHMIQTHVDHCIEMLRQFVMCHADVGLVASHWIAGADQPWPDFNTKKVCRDFDGILEWTLKHQAPPGTAMIPKKPQGVIVLAVPP